MLDVKLNISSNKIIINHFFITINKKKFTQTICFHILVNFYKSKTSKILTFKQHKKLKVKVYSKLNLSNMLALSSY